MPKTYYDSELTAEQIEDALTAIDGVVNPGNNGKVLYIEDGKIKAASASRWSGGYPEPAGTINISVNGLVNVKDYAEANVQVPGGGEIEVIPLSVIANDTYTAPAGKAYSPVTVNVSGGGDANIFVGSIEPGGFDASGAESDTSFSLSARRRSTDFTPVTPSKTYEFLFAFIGSWQPRLSVIFYENQTTKISDTGWIAGNYITVTVPSNCEFIKFQISKGPDGTDTFSSGDQILRPQVYEVTS